MRTFLLIVTLMLSVFFNVLHSQTYRDRFNSSIKLKQDVDSDFTLTIISPTLAGSNTLVLPASTGTDTYYLSTDGSGILSWTSISSSGSPVGTEGSVQFNDSGAMAGDSLFVFVDSLNSLYVGLQPSSDISSIVAPSILVGKDGASGSLLIRSVNGSETYLVLRPTTTMAQDLVFEMPAVNGAVLEALVTDGSGVLSWGGNVQVGPVSENNTNNNNNVSNGADNAYIGGGQSNDINNSPTNVSIYGGNDNNVNNNADGSIIIGGGSNDLNNQNKFSFLFGGSDININNNAQSSGMAAGLSNNINNQTTNSIILAGSTNATNNNSDNVVIFAGQDNSFSNSQADWGVTMGGYDNNMQKEYNAAVGGNTHSYSNSVNRTVMFGGVNHNSQQSSTAFLGGNSNFINDPNTIIIGGTGSSIDDGNAAVIFGRDSDVGNNSDYSIVGGRDSYAAEFYQIALGRNVKGQNNDDNAVLFGDANSSNLNSVNSEEWRTRFAGGYRLFTNSGLSSGVQMNGNQSSWSSVSDSTKKQMILELNHTKIYNEIQSLGIYSWNYIGSKASLRNYSPMAQEFYTLFGKDEIGSIGTDTTISELDLTSIFLAGVKGARTKVEIVTTKLESAEQKLDIAKLRIEELSNRIAFLRSDAIEHKGGE